MPHPLRDEILMILTEYDDRPYTAQEIADLINKRGFYQKAGGINVTDDDVRQSINYTIQSSIKNNEVITITVFEGNPSSYMY